MADDKKKKVKISDLTEEQELSKEEMEKTAGGRLVKPSGLGTPRMLSKDSEDTGDPGCSCDCPNMHSSYESVTENG